MVSVFHRIQHVKMCKKNEFQVNNTDGFLFAKGNRLEGWGNVPHSKNSSWGHFPNRGPFLIVISMSKCVRILIFKDMGQVIFYLRREALSEGWGKVAHSKHSFGSIF